MEFPQYLGEYGIDIDEKSESDDVINIDGIRAYMTGIQQYYDRDRFGYMQMQLKPVIKRLYDRSRLQICNIADSIARGIIKDGETVEIFSEAKEPELPKTEIWDFQLGDPVMIKCSREDFKWMQGKILGWNERLNGIYGHVGFVSQLGSKYNNDISVYFPEDFAGYSIYAGALEKVDPPDYPDLLSRWKVGDFVETITSKKTLRLLQSGLDQIPDKLIGVKGRVVRVTHPCVKVTFDERKTYDLKSASLVECMDQSPITIKEEIKHPRGFEIGEKVTVKSNLKNLIRNQRFVTERWDSAMCSIQGKLATIVRLWKSNSLQVQTEHSRAWRISPDSVLHLGEDETEEEDFKFLPGDVVKVVLPDNTQANLSFFEVPMVFLEFLRSTAIVECVDNDHDYHVRFNADQHVQVDEKLLRKATTFEKQKHEGIEKRVKELKVGDTVHLDAGPPNYVRKMIQELRLDLTIKMAMVESAKLVGFINFNTAVIKYENGQRFRVKKKFLTVPEKFHVNRTENDLSQDVINCIYNKVKLSIQDIHSRENAPTENWKVNTTFMCTGSPPYFEYKVESTVASFEACCDWLNENSGWEIESLGSRQFVIRNIQGYDGEVKVAVTFNDEANIFSSRNVDFGRELASNEDEGPEKKKSRRAASPAKDNEDTQYGIKEPLPDRGEEKQAEETVGNSAEEASAFGVMERPAEETPVHTDDQEPAAESSAHKHAKMPTPGALGIKNMKFKYIKLHDPSIARDIYFPYIVGSETRDPVQPPVHDFENYAPSDITNTFEHVDSMIIYQ